MDFFTILFDNCYYRKKHLWNKNLLVKLNGLCLKQSKLEEINHLDVMADYVKDIYVFFAKCFLNGS